MSYDGYIMFPLNDLRMLTDIVRNNITEVAAAPTENI